MAHGKTLELRQFENMLHWRVIRRRETVTRNRSLNGKARIKARKDENKSKKLERTGSAFIDQSLEG